MSDLMAFIRARLEDRAGDLVHDFDCERVISGSPGTCDCHATELMLREVAAIRAIVDACERALASIPFGHRADFARGVLGFLAAIWGKHPDFRQEWTVEPTPYHPDRWKPPERLLP